MYFIYNTNKYNIKISGNDIFINSIKYQLPDDWQENNRLKIRIKKDKIFINNYQFIKNNFKKTILSKIIYHLF